MMSRAIFKLHLARGGARAPQQPFLLPCTFHPKALSAPRSIKMHAIQSDGQDKDLPFPDLPSVREDQEREEENELPLPQSPPPAPEPDNPMPELPPNHPKEVRYIEFIYF